MTSYASAEWDKEYSRKGIPSSRREDASGVVVWALANYGFAAGKDCPTHVLDAGCGTGRNTIYVQAQTGAHVTGIDYSAEAISRAVGRSASKARFEVGDLTAPLHFENGSLDLVMDVFVYFHILADKARRRYREELRRVLQPDGVLLISMATDADEFYACCETRDSTQSVPVKWDPVANVGNILPTQTQLLAEFADLFAVSMTWQKTKSGWMHGRQYMRSTTALLLKPL